MDDLLVDAGHYGKALYWDIHRRACRSTLPGNDIVDIRRYVAMVILTLVKDSSNLIFEDPYWMERDDG